MDIGLQVQQQPSKLNIAFLRCEMQSIIATLNPLGKKNVRYQVMQYTHSNQCAISYLIEIQFSRAVDLFDLFELILTNSF
jgi:hypothetical protein